MNVLHQLLTETNYDKEETQFIINGFQEGFPSGYQGPENRQQTAGNLTLKYGSVQDLWSKMMK